MLREQKAKKTCPWATLAGLILITSACTIEAETPITTEQSRAKEKPANVEGQILFDVDSPEHAAHLAFLQWLVDRLDAEIENGSKRFPNDTLDGDEYQDATNCEISLRELISRATGYFNRPAELTDDEKLRFNTDYEQIEEVPQDDEPPDIGTLFHYRPLRFGRITVSRPYTFIEVTTGTPHQGSEELEAPQLYFGNYFGRILEYYPTFAKGLVVGALRTLFDHECLVEESPRIQSKLLVKSRATFAQASYYNEFTEVNGWDELPDYPPPHGWEFNSEWATSLIASGIRHYNYLEPFLPSSRDDWIDYVSDVHQLDLRLIHEFEQRSQDIEYLANQEHILEQLRWAREVGEEILDRIASLDEKSTSLIERQRKTILLARSLRVYIKRASSFVARVANETDKLFVWQRRRIPAVISEAANTIQQVISHSQLIGASPPIGPGLLPVDWRDEQVTQFIQWVNERTPNQIGEDYARYVFRPREE